MRDEFVLICIFIPILGIFVNVPASSHPLKEKYTYTLEQNLSSAWTIGGDTDYIYFGRSGKIEVRNKNNLSLVTRLNTTPDGLTKLSYTYGIESDSNYVYGGDWNGVVWIYNKSNWSLVTNLTGIEGKIYEIDDDSTRLYVASYDVGIYVINKTDWSFIQNLTIKYGVESVAVDDRYIYGGGYKKIRVWNKTNYSYVTDLTESSHYSVTLIITDKELLYAGEGERPGQIWIYNTTNLSLYGNITAKYRWTRGGWYDDHYLYFGNVGGLKVYRRSNLSYYTSLHQKYGQNPHGTYVDENRVYVAGGGYPISIYKKLLAKIPPSKKRLLLVNKQNTLSCSNLASKFPIIITNKVTKDIKHFINQYDPSQIISVGINYPDSISTNCHNLQMNFINNSKYLTLGDNHTLNLASLPLTKLEKLKINQSTFLNGIKINGKLYTNLEDLIDSIIENSDKINNILLINPDSENSVVGGILSSFRGNSIILPVKGSPEYIKSNLIELERKLRNNNLYTGSKNYKFGEPVYLTLIDVPYFNVTDPGLEELFNLDNDYLLTDNPYSDLNNDINLDLATGRLKGNLTTISLQIAREQIKPKLNKKALIASEYNHRKFLDILYKGGGMLSGFIADSGLINSKFNTIRLVERRSRFNYLDRNTIQKLKDEYNWILGLSLPGILKKLTKIYGVFEISDEAFYALLEFDWYEYLHKIYPIKINPLDDLTKKNLKSKLPKNDFIFYFGQGNGSEWILPKSNRSNSQLIKNPYPADSPTLKQVPYLKNSLIYDDHDLSAKGSLWRKFVNKGAIGIIGSEGITHDIQAQFTLIRFLGKLLESKSIGESITYAKNRNLRSLGLSSLYRLAINQQSIPKINLDLKEGLERTLYGDPQYKPLSSKIEKPQKYQTTYSKGEIIIEKSFSNNYTLTPNHTILISTNDHLLKFGKPILPLKTYDFSLPTNTKILDINFTGKYTSVESVSVPILPYDEYYNKTSNLFSGIFPNQSFWYQESNLLDNRSSILVTAPLVIYKNNTADVLKNGKIKIKYQSFLDIINLKAKTEKINLTIINNMDRLVEPNIFLRIENSTGIVSEQAKKTVINPNSKKTLTFGWKSKKGSYLIKVIGTYNNLTIGPKKKLINITYAEEVKTPRLKKAYNLITGKVITKIAEITTPFWKIKETFSSKKLQKTHIKPNWNLSVKERPNYKIVKLKAPEFHLLINLSSKRKDYYLTCSEGSLNRTISNGAIQENYQGNEDKLRNILKKGLKFLENYKKINK